MDMLAQVRFVRVQFSSETLQSLKRTQNLEKKIEKKAKTAKWS